MAIDTMLPPKTIGPTGQREDKAMKKIEVFLQVEGGKDIVLVHVPQGGSVRDLLHVAKEHGPEFREDDAIMVFIEDMDEAVELDVLLEDAGISHRGHVHVHRCHRVEVSVNFNGMRVSDSFPPSATVARIKKWAAKELGMSEKDAAEHVLEVSGTKVSLDEDIHVGTLVVHPGCQISLDLRPKVRVEG
jgi:hypothetical protein